MCGCWGNGEYVCVAIPEAMLEVGWDGLVLPGNGGEREEEEGERRFRGFQFCCTRST
jgi:hypothetical protein